jgi:hypothetical protein
MPRMKSPPLNPTIISMIIYPKSNPSSQIYPTNPPYINILNNSKSLSSSP